MSASTVASNRQVIRGSLLLMTVAGTHLLMAESAVAAPDKASVEASLGEIVISGADETDGNNPKYSRGSGFFIDRFGRFVTAHHVLTDLLPAVNRAGMTVRVTPRACDSKSREASVLYENALADLMVLIVDTDNCKGIFPLPKATLIEAKVEPLFRVFTVGYYDPGHPAWYDGVVSSMMGHPSPPKPRLLCDLFVDSGQSGSPVLASDGRVIAVAVASQNAALTAALATPITELPLEHFANAGLASPAQAPPTVASVDAAPTIVARAEIAPSPRIRTVPISFANPNLCAVPAPVSTQVAAESGWYIDPESVVVRVKSLVGGFREGPLPSIEARSDSIVVRGTLVNVGGCVRVAMPEVDTSFPPQIRMVDRIQEVGQPGEFVGELVFTEIPVPGRLVEQEIASARVVAGVPSGLQDVFAYRASLPRLTTSVRTQNEREAEVSLDLASRAARGQAAAVREIADRANADRP